MSEWPWSVLDVAADSDERAIRRAYARQLKLHRPDRDPEGFQQLRSAFEAALQSCQFAVMFPDDSEEAEEGLAPQVAAELPRDEGVPEPAPHLPDAEDAPVRWPCEPELEMLSALVERHEAGDAAAAACLANLLQDPRLTLDGCRQYVEKRLLGMIASLSAGPVLWPLASEYFGWDVDDPAFLAAWPHVAAQLNHDRLAGWAGDVVEACQQDARSGLRHLKSLLNSNALMSIDLRLAFYRHLADALCEWGGVDLATFNEMCVLVGWQANGFCPKELPEYQWQHLLQQVDAVEIARNNEQQWQAMQGIAGGRVPAPAADRRVMRAILSHEAPRWIECLRPGLTEQVQQKLSSLDVHFPALTEKLQPAVIDFWRFRALLVPDVPSFDRFAFWLIVAGSAAGGAAWPMTLFCWLGFVFLYIFWLDPQMDRLLQRQGAEVLFYLQAFRWTFMLGLFSIPLYKLGISSTIFSDVDWLKYVPLVAGLTWLCRHLTKRGRLLGVNLLAIKQSCVAMGPFWLVRYCMRKPESLDYNFFFLILSLLMALIYAQIIVHGFLI